MPARASARLARCDSLRHARPTGICAATIYAAISASAELNTLTVQLVLQAGCKLIIAARRADRLAALREKLVKDFGVGDPHSALPNYKPRSSDTPVTYMYLSSYELALNKMSTLQVSVHAETLDVTDTAKVAGFADRLPVDYQEVMLPAWPVCAGCHLLFLSGRAPG